MISSLLSGRHPDTDGTFRSPIRVTESLEYNKNSLIFSPQVWSIIWNIGLSFCGWIGGALILYRFLGGEGKIGDLPNVDLFFLIIISL